MDISNIQLQTATIDEDILYAGGSVIRNSDGNVESISFSNEKQLEVFAKKMLINWLNAQPEVAYLARRKDWAPGQLSPFSAEYPLTWASEKIPLIVKPTILGD